MENQIVTPFNWNYTQYHIGDKKAIISIGASQEIIDGEFIYFVTLLDSDDKEIFQKEFSTIAKACDYINERYEEDALFVDLSKPKSDESGCSTCVAH